MHRESDPMVVVTIGVAIWVAGFISLAVWAVREAMQ
jgi:hypothetical protein